MGSGQKQYLSTLDRKDLAGDTLLPKGHPKVIVHIMGLMGFFKCHGSESVRIFLDINLSAYS